jgi:hypothetical protein
MIAAAVAIGVTVVLSVFADYHAYQAVNSRPCWECTHAAPGHVAAGGSELWNYSENIYQGRFVEQLDVAALGPGAPVVPGLSRLPTAGQYYASPALARLLATVPPDELGDRFAGTQVGTIGDKALSGPSQLVIVIGYTPAALAKLPGTMTVDHIATAAELEGTTGIYRMAFGIGALAVLFPLLILINTATRLAASRREERYAAMRLVGGTPRQVNLIASVEAVVSAFIGTVLGIVVFIAIRPALASISLSGNSFFSQYVTPTALGYGAMVVGVPLASAVASLWSLRRVRISPLGVSRKVRRRPPGVWRVLPLMVGIPLFLEGVSRTARGSDANGVVFAGFGLILIGLVVGGTWLTMQAARLLARFARGASSLLAARRLADNPKSSFRTVSGLVLAVFVGTVIASLVPVFNAAETNLGGANSLANVLRVPYNNGPGMGLPPTATDRLMDGLRRYSGVTSLVIYANPASAATYGPPPPSSSVPLPPPPPPMGVPGAALAKRQRHGPATLSIWTSSSTSASTSTAAQYDSIISCAGLTQFPALGHCAPGLEYVYANAANVLFTDNPLFVASALPLVTTKNPAAPSTMAHLDLGAVLLKTTNSATLEKVRTFLTVYNSSLATTAGVGITAWQMGDVEPETFGEVAQIRNDDVNNIESVVLAIVGLTLLVAACSLAVTVGGGIVERKRPFTLLRVSGTSRLTLYKVVLTESMLPLLGAAGVAAGVAVAITGPLVRAVPKIQKDAYLAVPGVSYYVAMGAGLLIALIVMAVTLPVLDRVTSPDKVRFE